MSSEVENLKTGARLKKTSVSGVAAGSLKKGATGDFFIFAKEFFF